MGKAQVSGGHLGLRKKEIPNKTKFGQVESDRELSGKEAKQSLII